MKIVTLKKKIVISSERKTWLNNNIKSHRKPVLHLLSGKYIFGKTTGGSVWPPTFLGLMCVRYWKVIFYRKSSAGPALNVHYRQVSAIFVHYLEALWQMFFMESCRSKLKRPVLREVRYSAWRPLGGFTVFNYCHPKGIRFLTRLLTFDFF